MEAVSEGRDVLYPGDPGRNGTEFVVESTEHHEREQQ